VENEPGIVGTDRDYSPRREAVYKAPVSPEFIAAMKKHGKGATWELWQKAGAKKNRHLGGSAGLRAGCRALYVCLAHCENTSMLSPKPGKPFIICRCLLICGLP